MKRNHVTLVVLMGIGLLASCKKSDINPGNGSQDPKNIQEVAALIESAGNLSIPPEKNDNTSKTLDSTYYGNYEVESTGNTEACSKVTKRMKYNFTENSMEFSLLDPWPSILWPGCLVQGKSLRGENVPSPIPIYSKRKPGTIVLQIVSGAKAGEQGEGTWYKEVKEMRNSRVVQAQNDLIREWRHSGIPAKTSYTLSVVHSFEETAIKAGLDVRAFGKLKSSLNTTFKKEHSYVLVKLYQQFYTLSYEDPEGFKGVFTQDIQKSDLANYTGPGNPICYVSSVTYGRAYYLLVESTISSSKLIADLNAAFGPVKVDGSVKVNKTLSQSTIRMVQYGGDAQAGLAGAIDPHKLSTFIQEGAIPSDKNVGAPISFTVRHLRDGELVRMSNTLNYEYDKVEYYPLQKANNVAFFLSDVVVNVSGAEGRLASNNGYIKVVGATVEYASSSSSVGARTKTFNLKDVSEAGIRSTAFMNINKIVDQDCGRELGKIRDLVHLKVQLELRPEAYTKGLLGTGIGGKREGTGVQHVELVRTFIYNYKEQAWKVSDTSGETTSSALGFRKLSTKRTFENLTFYIDVNYSVFVDNQLIE